jgi:diguanylate cyclase (GGDEF)-like protein/PAS domain S-box-containing protein
MQKSLLDLLIIGLLVVFFGSIYRGNATVRTRYWLIGWLFALVHFGFQLHRPAGAVAANWLAWGAMSGLFLCGASFALASKLTREIRWRQAVPAGLLALPAIVYVAFAALASPSRWLMLGLAAAVQAAFAGVTIRLGRHTQDSQTARQARHARRWGAAILGGASVWMGVAIIRASRPELAVHTIACEIFLLNAVLYWEEFPRATAGVLSAVVGLAAWGAMFPSALLLGWLAPHLHVSRQLWNLPEYFVAFGMILTLLEEQKREADDRFEEYRLMFENNPHPMWIFDTDTLRFLTVNDAAAQRYGYSEKEFQSMTLRDIRPPEEVEAMEQTVNSLAANERTVMSGPWTHILRDGRRIQVEVSSHSIRFRGRKARFSLVQDVTERQQLHHRLLYQAHHDMLTGLPNRLLLLDRMEQALAMAERKDRKAALICLDLDRFKQINDTYGHAVGDLCLKQVAERLRSRIRASDTVARSGGEEFAVVVGDLATVADAEKIASDLLAALRKPLVVDQYPIDLTASFGVAIYPDHGTDAPELWRSADAAMYRVKWSGGNDFVLVSQEISRSTTEANELEMSMRRALKEGGFEVYYQPEYTADGRLCGLEALLRLHHPRYGLVGPDRFIPIAEESGLIVPVGYWVLREVCRQCEEWKRQGLAVPRIAINVSPLQFMRVDFSVQVREALADLGASPGNLQIEVTETAVMRNMEDVARQMRDLADLGVHFAIDDFGTGYSSLQHLHQLPIQTLKIDRSFVERLCEPEGTSALVEAILSLAHSLGLQVVAEGVEIEEQAEALKKMNCDIFQGYLFARPQPADAIPALLRSAPVEWLRETAETVDTLSESSGNDRISSKILY